MLPLISKYSLLADSSTKAIEPVAASIRLPTVVWGANGTEAEVFTLLSITNPSSLVELSVHDSVGINAEGVDATAVTLKLEGSFGALLIVCIGGGAISSEVGAIVRAEADAKTPTRRVADIKSFFIVIDYVKCMYREFYKNSVNKQLYFCK